MKIKKCLISIFILVITSVFYPQSLDQKSISTFSIVARDSVTGELGIAVASRFFSVGSVVPRAKANVGAVATQSFANTSFGWRGLEFLQAGATPKEALEILLRNDDAPPKSLPSSLT
jgi:hypothetical protein